MLRIACITQPKVIKAILEGVERKERPPSKERFVPERGWRGRPASRGLRAKPWRGLCKRFTCRNLRDRNDSCRQFPLPINTLTPDPVNWDSGDSFSQGCLA